jgi:hypothetical protein
METTMRARWATPALSLAMGLAFLVASAIGGQAGTGLAMLAVMVVYSAVLLAFGRRSDTMGVLAGQPVDERLEKIGLHATAVAGIAAILVALAGFLWAIANGQSGTDFALVVASAGIAYLAAAVWFRWRG